MNIPMAFLIPALAATLSVSTRANQITFSSPICQSVQPPFCPQSQRFVGNVASDSISIDEVASDVPGFTTPIAISGGVLTFTTPALTGFGFGGAFRELFDNPGGSIRITGSVFGLPADSELFSGIFQPGTLYVEPRGSDVKFVQGSLQVILVSEEVLSGLGLGGLPNIWL